MDPTRTPYNSIYEALKDKKQETELICCVHGAQCRYGTGSKECKLNGVTASDENNQYVNLDIPLPDKEKDKAVKEREVAAQLTAKLKQLANGQEEQKGRGKPEMMSLNSLINVRKGGERVGPEKSGKKRSGRSQRKKKSAPANDEEVKTVKSTPSLSLVSATPASPQISQQGQHNQSTPPTQSASTPTSDTSASTVTPEVVPTKPGAASSAYIGVLSLTDAETNLSRRGEFALYHLFNPEARLDTLHESLPLMLVYRTTTKKCRHYTIRTTVDHQFFVDCGYPNVRLHVSLNQMVMYYKTSATLEINPDDTSADSFSWWLE